MPNTSTAYSRATPTVNGRSDHLHPQSDAETTQPVQSEADRSVTEWLEALADGECDRAVLLRGIADSITANPETGWEFLALVDQYYRRNKITAEDFRSLNAQVRALLIGRPPAAKVTSLPNPTPPTHAPTTQKARPAERPAPRRAVVIGDVLRNRYRIQGILGHGGMGTVYAALDQYRLEDGDGGQRVALKVLHTEIVQRPHLLEELRGEFQRLQTLSHPNIVRVHELDHEGELTFFTMEYLSGAPLSRVFAIRNSVALRRPHALAIIRKVGTAIAYAHSRGIVHGDLNPGNIFVTDDGGIRVLDFGASHRLRPDPSISDVEDLSRVAVATPSYASCELLVGRAPDARDDIYSLACISYVLLTGRHPFAGRTALAARTDHLTPRRPKGLSGRQWRALRAGLQVDRKRRPDNLEAWLAQLDLPTNPAKLPVLPSIMGALPPRELHVRWAAGPLIALVAAVGWWAQANTDFISSTAAGLGASATQLWSNIRGDSSPHAPPAPAVPVELSPVPAAPPAAVSDAATTASAKAAAGAAPTVSHITPRQATPPATHAAATGTPTGPAGLARVELAADAVNLSPSQPVASVVVNRRHSYRNGVSFSWWTESGTAKPGEDFVPVKPRTDYIGAGENETRLLIPIVADPRRRVAKSFYVVVGDPSEDATLGSRTITMVTIPAAY